MTPLVDTLCCSREEGWWTCKLIVLSSSEDQERKFEDPTPNMQQPRRELSAKWSFYNTFSPPTCTLRDLFKR